jgi:hypothetical protein
MAGWADRGWSWRSILAQSAVVGLGLGGMTYLADWGSRGSLIFGVLMGIGWLVAFAIARVVREQAGAGHSTAVTLRENWFRFAVWALLALDAVFLVLCLAVGRAALALVTALLAIPFVLAAAFQRPPGSG